MHSLIKTAYDWHGGQTSPLYSFASTGGVVHSADHRHNLIDEINENINLAQEKDKPALKALLEHVLHAEKKTPLDPVWAKASVTVSLKVIDYSEARGKEVEMFTLFCKDGEYTRRRGSLHGSPDIKGYVVIPNVIEVDGKPH